MVLSPVAHMIAVIGCGNPTRQDDGVGPQVIQTLKGRGLDGAKVMLLDAGTDGMAVMFAARGCSSLIVIDAARAGAEPGAIYEVPGGEIQRPYGRGLNLHDFRWDAALDAGRRIFREAFPSDVTVFLVEAAELGYGVGLTPDVARAADEVAARIETLIEHRLSIAPA